MNKGFRSLTDRIIDQFHETSPLAATSAGAHAYDHLVDRYDSEGRQQRRALARDALKELRSFENASLTQTELMDLSVLQGELLVQLRVEQDVKLYERNATVYVDRLLDALYTMVVREYAPAEERGKALLERLKAMPRYLEIAVENLKAGYDVPAVWTEVAIETLDGADLFWRESLQPFVKKAGGKGNEEFQDAAEGARRLLLKFKSFLKDDLLPRCDGSFAVGRDLFDFLLDKEHGLSLRAKDLLAIGEEAVASARAEMAKVAADIAPGKSLEKLISDLKRQHPAADKVLQAYKKEMERARDFVARKDLVTVPEKDRLTVCETPAYARALVPYAAYLPPAPLESKGEGLFWVTPVDRSAPADRRHDQLEGHAMHGIPVTALHEGYPGHHLQHLHAHRATSKVRRLASTSSFCEGWALYCEEMMWEEGFYSDPRVRLLQLKDLLFRAWRVVLDVKLHLQQVSIEDAVDALVEHAMVERSNALLEVRRYTLSPTQPMSYLIGRREILALREQAKLQRGEKWKLKDFHDKLLSFGTIPIPLVKDAILR
jgi:uncharacterized protein (DUF885 family)